MAGTKIRQNQAQEIVHNSHGGLANAETAFPQHGEHSFQREQDDGSTPRCIDAFCTNIGVASAQESSGQARLPFPGETPHRVCRRLLLAWLPAMLSPPGRQPDLLEGEASLQSQPGPPKFEATACNALESPAILGTSLRKCSRPRNSYF